MDTSKYSGYKDFVWAIELNRFGFLLLGLWPEIDEMAKNNFTSDLRMGIILVTMIFMLAVPLICSLVRVWGDMMLIIDNLQITLPVLVALLKIIVMRWKRTAALSIVRMMAEDWTEAKTLPEKDEMIRRARIGRLIVIIGYILMGCVVFIVVLLPACGLPFRQITNLTDRNRLLPLQAYYFYDTDRSPQFEFTLFIQAILVFLAGISYTSVDAFFGLAILHMCGQLENFRHRLGNLNCRKNFDVGLRNNVRTHLRLIRFANIINEMFAIMMLGLVFYFAVAFCLFGFLLIAVLTDDMLSNISTSRKLFGAIGVITVFVHTFLYCIAGEIMADQCQEVYNAICNLEWYELESRNGRTLILLMLRTSRSFQISAGYIISLTMTSFCSLLKTSAGYISFLLAKQG